MAARRQQDDVLLLLEKLRHAACDMLVWVQDEIDLSRPVTGKLYQRSSNGLKTFRPALAPMARDEHCRKSAIARHGRRERGRHLQQCVDAAVAGDVDFAPYTFELQVPRRMVRWSEQQIGLFVDRRTILLFGPWRGRIVGAQPGLDMRDRHSCHKSGEGGSQS